MPGAPATSQGPVGGAVAPADPATTKGGAEAQGGSWNLFVPQISLLDVCTLARRLSNSSPMQLATKAFRLARCFRGVL